ncbi:MULTISPECIES: TetR/AcrR family transcriptional regulator C-terminal domain-containing protein [Streptomyces]|uniref:TetR family transcriptional regulator n=1 Tax=Streptomyces lycii TaxID=2654337 RepID=A0ABQ7FPF1_9ACTN|nr:TetR/AcrR family transcriptional regulator C-terminal domain-containing protein [Streptomyces lycii]KAF4409489.1 TetR family transcriptional regulator [Streptomyces lycii]
MATRLDQALVVDTALRLLNETGLDGLTLRRIAKELDVQAPALYWHFKNKQALLDAMATAMMRRMVAEADTLAAGPSASWQQWITDACRTLRGTLLDYRDGAKVFSGSRFTDTTHAGPLEKYLRFFRDSGFTVAQGVNAYTTAYHFTIGFVIEEQGMRPGPDGRRGNFDLAEREAWLAPDHPLAAEAGWELFGNYEERFELGLRAIVAGLEHTLRSP